MTCRPGRTYCSNDATIRHREPLLLSPVREKVHAYLATVLKNQESPAQRVGGTSDHVRALFRLTKNISLANIVEEIKTSSSRWIKTQGGAFSNFHWRRGYRGFSVSPGKARATRPPPCLKLVYFRPSEY
jgi:REP element-mobilizing transposase RayT